MSTVKPVPGKSPPVVVNTSSASVYPEPALRIVNAATSPAGDTTISTVSPVPLPPVVKTPVPSSSAYPSPAVTIARVVAPPRAPPLIIVTTSFTE